ncbi:hypothetical protein B0H10DRAFT_2208668 [Mycena sp. CBHHK59/15]|nr:hypothetical protein B0H10DRAFT_2208668 [Mycena sp. CBHHK59/15]
MREPENSQRPDSANNTHRTPSVYGLFPTTVLYATAVLYAAAVLYVLFVRETRRRRRLLLPRRLPSESLRCLDDVNGDARYLVTWS